MGGHASSNHLLRLRQKKLKGKAGRERQGAAALNRILLVQGLRAAAALAVVLHHVLHEAYGSSGLAWLAGPPWDAGVDVFFVISGFVMVHASARMFGVPGAWAVFLRRRLARIAPLYWAATLAFLLAMLLLPGKVNTPAPDMAWLLASLAFLPWARPDGVVVPVYSLGWTLNYEMFFYAAFALALPLRRGRAVAAVAGALGGVVLAGWLWPPRSSALAFWADPIILQFVAGMGVALLAARQLRLPGAMRWVLAGLGLLLLLALPAEWARGLRFAPGATLLLMAAALGPTPALPGPVALWLGRLGDASYALYLLHPFALRGVAVLVAAWGLPAGLASALALVLAVALAPACHAWFEAPLTRALQRKG